MQNISYWMPYIITFCHFLTNYNSMAQSLCWETNGFSAFEEIPHILWNPVVQYYIQSSPPPVPILSHINPSQTPPPPQSYFLKIIFNITLLSTNRSSKTSLSLRFPHQHPICFCSPHTCIMPLPSPCSWCNHSNSVRYKSRSSSLCSLLQYPVTFSFLDPNIVLNTIFWARCLGLRLMKCKIMFFSTFIVADGLCILIMKVSASWHLFCSSL